MDNTKKLIGQTFLDIANAIDSGDFGNRPKIALTTLGSEHGSKELVKGAELAAKDTGFDVVLIGDSCGSSLKTYETNDEKEMHKIMEDLLDKKEVDACVTMHYNFPIGVSTVGKVVTPSLGKDMIIATTTGTSATNRTEAMLKNTIHGIIAAKASGIKKPTVGFLNIEGARQVEIAIKKLIDNGYEVNFAESTRADGGTIMRGNDMLKGAADVMVVDSLTGNIMMKVFSSYQTGGSYEASGYGYGPGIGQGYDRNILILSRASGAPVVAGAIKYAASLVKGNLNKVQAEEFDKVNKAKFADIINEINAKSDSSKDKEEVKMPAKKIVTKEISGIEIMDLEDAVKCLWKADIYSESGMGCTGPIVLIHEDDLDVANKILKENGYI